MYFRHLCAVAALIGGIAFVCQAQAQISVTSWPGDVPCSALTNNGDGTYTLNQAVTIGDDTTDVIAAGNIFPTTDEYNVWAVNCP
jgi:uncharacterized membrane protein YdcZ (DUF606 family)